MTSRVSRGGRQTRCPPTILVDNALDPQYKSTLMGTTDERSGVGWATALRSMLAFPFAPRRMLLRLHDLTLAQVFLLHLIAIVSWPVMGLLLKGWGESYNFIHHSPRNISYPHALWISLGDVWQSAHALGFWLLAMLLILAIEVGCIVASLLLVPWAAHPEPVRETAGRCLRTVWLNTFHGAWWILAVGGMYVWLTQVFPGAMWYQGNPTRGWPDWGRWEEVWSRTERNDLLVLWTGTLVSVWVLTVWLRGASTPTARFCPLDPAQCDGCGYLLPYASREGRCPECGRPIRESLGPDARKPPQWESPEGQYSVGQFIGCTLQVWGGLGQFCASLPTRSGHPAARAFLLLHVAIASGATCALYVLALYLANGRVPDKTMAYLPVVWARLAAVLLGITAVVGLTAGSIRTGLDDRNQMPAVAKVVFYGSALFLPCGVVVMGMMVVVAAIPTELWELSRDLLGTSYLLPMLLFVGAFLGCLCLYGHAVYRGVQAVRYANQ